MMWTNIHTHTNYCDGKGEPVEYIRSAIQLGIMSVGFSSHAPLPFDCSWCMKPWDLDIYLTEIGLLKKSIINVEIYAGLEVDYIPGIIGPGKFRHKLDYSIGSIHFVDQLPDGQHWEIDGTHALFTKGLKEIFNNNIRDVITKYYALTRQMVMEDCPSVVGHLDKIKIQNNNNFYFSETDDWYQNEIIKTLDVIADSGAVIEVNTRGLYQKKSITPYPSPWILEKMHERKIPITLSSDAHHADDLINKFQQTACLLNQIGFKKITILKEGEWQQHEFNEQGIITN